MFELWFLIHEITSYIWLKLNYMERNIKSLVSCYFIFCESIVNFPVNSLSYAIWESWSSWVFFFFKNFVIFRSVSTFSKEKTKNEQQTIIFLALWGFLMIYQIFFSPQVKRCAITLNMGYRSCLSKCQKT